MRDRGVGPGLLENMGLIEVFHEYRKKISQYSHYRILVGGGVYIVGIGSRGNL